MHQSRFHSQVDTQARDLGGTPFPVMHPGRLADCALCLTEEGPPRD